MNKYFLIIPYRNRQTHLSYFIENTLSILPDNFKVCVVEQNDEQLFNRGKLLNIGFLECQDSFDYFFTHDVDINPTKETFEKYYNVEIEDDTVWGIYNSYCDTLGGIVLFRKDLFSRVNGFPNNFFGWGSEDKALQNRVQFAGLKIQKNILNNDPNKFDYFKIFNDVDDRKVGRESSQNHSKEYYIFPRLSNQEKVQHLKNQGGLDHIQYEIISKEELIKNKVLKIKVNI